MKNVNTSLISAVLLLMSLSAFADQMIISGTPAATATVGQAYYFAPSVKNGIAGEIQFSYINLPDWAKRYRGSGIISGTPTRPGVWANIQIVSSDGVHYAETRPFTITVKAAKPAAVLKISGTPGDTAQVGTFYDFTPTVLAAVGSTLTFSVQNKPAWLQFNKSTGSLSGTPTTASVASYANIVVSVSNGSTTAALPAYTIAVSPQRTGTASVSWIKPTRNTDGSTTSNISGYFIRYGTSIAALNKQ